MPYVVSPYEGGYRVYNIDSGVAYSNKPMTYENAVKQLRVLNMALSKEGGEGGNNEDDFLNIAKYLSKQYGYNPKDLYLSDDGIHKLLIITPTNEVVRFGRKGYGDYIHYKIQESKGIIPKGEADKHRERYLKRSENIKGWDKENMFSKNSLSRNILWNA